MSFRSFLLFLFFTYSSLLNCQSEKTIAYFSKSGTLAEAAESHYFRVSSDTTGYFRSYFTKDSTLYFSGKILNFRDSVDQKNRYEGLCTWYYENGAKHIVSDFNKQGQLHGNRYEYHMNGNILKKQYFQNGRLAGKYYMEYESNGDSTEIYSEDFFPGSDTCWIFRKEPSIHNAFKLGGLLLSNSSDEIKYVLSKQKNVGVNFSGEVSINQNYVGAENSAGLVFVSNDSNFRYFLVSKKHFFIGEKINGKITQKITDYYCDKLDALGWNTIKITKAGKKMLYSINNYIVFIEPIDTLRGSFGLSVNKNTTCLFDNFKCSRSSFANDKNLKTETGLDLQFLFKDAHSSVREISNGIIVNKRSVLAYLEKPPAIINKVSVLLQTDTGTMLLAGEITARSVSNHFIVKLKEDLPQPGYIFYNNDLVGDDSNVISINISKNSPNLKVVTASGKLRTNARAGNFTTTFDCFLTAENNFEKGAPVFTNRGELLGIVTKSKDDASLDGVSKVIKVDQIIEFLVHNSVDISSQKKKSIQEFTIKPDTVHKSLVLVIIH